jgi:hypothetical protein
MRISIHDDNRNWLHWGRLVVSWIHSPGARPNTVGDLKQQLAHHHVRATVAGTDDRQVSILNYSDNTANPLMLVLPTEKMLEEKLKTVTSGAYPIPLFYDIAYAGAARADLSAQESHDFALRRIGEYTVNECC